MVLLKIKINSDPCYIIAITLYCSRIKKFAFLKHETAIVSHINNNHCSIRFQQREHYSPYSVFHFQDHSWHKHDPSATEINADLWINNNFYFQFSFLNFFPTKSQKSDYYKSMSEKQFLKKIIFERSDIFCVVSALCYPKNLDFQSITVLLSHPNF